MFPFLRKYIAGLIAILSLALIVYFRETLILLIDSEKIFLDGLYAAVFDWSAIQTGFLFGVFGFIAGKQDGFVGALSGTVAMDNFTWALKKAMGAGFLLTFTSMPLIVTAPNPVTFGLPYIFVALWFSLFVWAFMLFCLVAYNFGIIVRVKDNTEQLSH